MYFKKKESEYRKSEKQKHTERLYKNYGGGIYRIEDIKSREIIKDIPVKHFLEDPVNNLYEGIRDKALEYFAQEKIKWWKVNNKNIIKQEKTYEVTPNDMPTRDMLSSQVACINHFFPVRDDKESVLGIAKIICPDFVDVLPIETDKYFPAYIQFEAVSEIDHLNETELPGIKPPRGEYSTSIDALIYAIHKNGGKYLIPIEWKYTEEYEYSNSPDDKSGGNSGKTRLNRYSGLIDNSLYLKNYSSYINTVYFYEPFYQLMRQTLWVEQMIKHKNDEIIKADNFIHVHIIPNENTELLDLKYQVTGLPMKESWMNNLKYKEKYKIITPMELINGIDKVKNRELINYLSNRYWNKT